MVRRIIWISTFLSCIVVIFISNFEFVRVIGFSMEPTLPHNCLIIALKTKSNQFFNSTNSVLPNYFLLKNQIVIFSKNCDNDNLNKEYFVKRCIGIPFEIIKIHKNGLYVNNSKVLAHFGDTENNIDIIDTCKLVAKAEDSISSLENNPCSYYCFLQRNQFFVIGDNLDESQDSRSFGPISFESVICIGVLKICNWKITKC